RRTNGTRDPRLEQVLRRFREVLERQLLPQSGAILVPALPGAHRPPPVSGLRGALGLRGDRARDPLDSFASDSFALASPALDSFASASFALASPALDSFASASFALASPALEELALDELVFLERPEEPDASSASSPTSSALLSVPSSVPLSVPSLVLSSEPEVSARRPRMLLARSVRLSPSESIPSLAAVTAAVLAALSRRSRNAPVSWPAPDESDSPWSEACSSRS